MSDYFHVKSCTRTIKFLVYRETFVYALHMSFLCLEIKVVERPLRVR